MFEAFFLGVGMVLVIEGLVIALAPKRFEEILIILSQIGQEARRLMGLTMIVLGILVVSGVRAYF